MRHVSYPPHTFDDLCTGARFESQARVVSREDIATFARVSGDLTALHTDETYAARTPLGGLVAHGVLILAVATGLAYELGVFEGTVLAVQSMEVRYERPVRPGDSLQLCLDVQALDARPRADRGRATFGVQVRNQDGRIVLSGAWQLLLRRASAPGGS